MKKKGYLKLPQNIYADNKVIITLSEFDDEEKLFFLPIDAIAKSKNGKKILKPKITNSANFFNRWFNYGYANYAYKIEYQPKKNNLNDWYILDVIDMLDKINLLILNHGFHMYLQRSKDYNYKSGNDKSHKYKNNEFEELTLSKIKQIQKIAKPILTHSHLEFEKLNTFLELKKVIENNGSPKGLKCSLMVTILESLFSNKDEKTEIRYRFPLRMTKYLKGDFDKEMKYIKKLYDNRSAYYHTGSDKFHFDDEAYLYLMTKRCLLEYIENPKKFNGKEMDKQLLK